MLRIIVNSYTCCPNMGSEPGMGWNWIINLARYCEVYVISEGEFRPQIEAWMEEQGATTSETLKIDAVESSCWYSLKNKEWQGRVCFYWNQVSPNVRKMCWNQGDWRFYRYYERWQRKTADIARDICGKNKIDILHQLNMIGFREPGYLWQVSKETGIPFVWGPIGGMKQFPMAYAKGGGLKIRLFAFVKNIINVLQIKYDRRVKKALNQAALLISSIPDSYEAIKKYHGLESVIIPETGCLVDEKIRNERYTYSKLLDDKNKSVDNDSAIKLLWVGKFDFRKRLDIALRIIAELRELNVSLVVFGSGNDEQVQKAKDLISELDIEDMVTLMGNTSNEVVKAYMQKSDLFLFTSVNEDTSTVVLEAISNELPVICFDTCGMAAVVDSSVGVKIPLSTPSQSVKDFAEKIEYLYNHTEELQRMSENCRARAEELSWENKAKQVVKLYESILSHKK